MEGLIHQGCSVCGHCHLLLGTIILLRVSAPGHSWRYWVTPQHLLLSFLSKVLDSPLSPEGRSGDSVVEHRAVFSFSLGGRLSQEWWGRHHPQVQGCLWPLPPPPSPEIHSPLGVGLCLGSKTSQEPTSSRSWACGGSGPGSKTMGDGSCPFSWHLRPGSSSWAPRSFFSREDHVKRGTFLCSNSCRRSPLQACTLVHELSWHKKHQPTADHLGAAPHSLCL